MTTKVQAEFLAPGAISDLTQVTAASADHLIIFDASDNTLKKALVSTISSSSAADDITAGDAAVTISTTSGNITIDNGSSDDDIIFKGTDGGSDITALTLDMSEAGKATFNAGIMLPDNGKLTLGAGEDLQIYHDGNNSIISDSGTGGLFLRGTDTVDIQSALGHNYLKSTISAGTQIYHNNTEKFATVSGGIKVTGGIENASGDMTIDVAGDLILDADGSSIKFKDGGTLNSRLGLDSAGLILTVEGADKDFFINGDDGGSAITAIRVDMSDAGALICNGDITAFGSPSDITLKENIEAIPDALDKVKQLKGVTFNYKKDGKKSTGLIAQDLEKVLPEVVYETSTVDNEEEKHLAVRYGNTVGLLVEAIKELSEKIQKLEDK